MKSPYINVAQSMPIVHQSIVTVLIIAIPELPCAFTVRGRSLRYVGKESQKVACLVERDHSSVCESRFSSRTGARDRRRASVFSDTTYLTDFSTLIVASLVLGE